MLGQCGLWNCSPESHAHSNNSAAVLQFSALTVMYGRIDKRAASSLTAEALDLIVGAIEL